MPRDRHSDWQRVNSQERCPVCERPDWCLRTKDGGRAICARVESGKPVGNKGAGWLHVLFDDGHSREYRRRIVFGQPVNSPKPDMTRLAAEYASAISPAHLERFAAGLGVSVQSLQSLGVGWKAGAWSWSFPMFDAFRVVRGIRLRAANGRKYSETGGSDGLFLPASVEYQPRLIVVEGPTDTAAMLDLGFAAVGRPSCRGAVPQLVELVKRQQPSEVVIVQDIDPETDRNGRPHLAGQRGAKTLADELLIGTAATVRVIEPDGAKDCRAWKQAGATRADILQRIEAAPVQRLDVRYCLEH